MQNTKSFSAMTRILLLTIITMTFNTLLFAANPHKATDPIAYLDLSYMWNYSPDNPKQVNEMWDILHSVATLQGIVNRNAPHIYINYVKNEFMEVDRYWWDLYRQKGKWLNRRDTVYYTDIVKLTEDYKEKIRGAVVYDTNVAST